MIQNESGGRNIPNVHQGTSSGQAQGYVQITTGTWRDFAPRAGIDLRKYPTPMKAADGSPVPWEVQSRVAGIIPLKRWDESTIAKMRATGKPIDPNRTLLENLTMNGESFADFVPGAKAQGQAQAKQYALPKAQAVGGAGVYQPPAPDPSNTAANATTSPSSVTPPYGEGQPPLVHEAQPVPYFLSGGKLGDTEEPKNALEVFGKGIVEASKAPLPTARKFQSQQPKAALVEGQVAPSVAPADPTRRALLAQVMAQLNSGRLF
jgi:hypothetical protein